MRYGVICIPSCYSSTTTFKDCYSELTAYTAIAYSVGLDLMTQINAKAMPTNNTDYSCHITAVYRTC